MTAKKANSNGKRPRHSAFEGPAIGTPVNIPKGKKMVIGKNGMSKIVKANTKTSRKKK